VAAKGHALLNPPARPSVGEGRHGMTAQTNHQVNGQPVDPPDVPATTSKGSQERSLPAATGNGHVRPQPGTVSAPQHGYLPVRPVPPRTPGSRPWPPWCFVGCHGGAGATTVTLAVPGGADAGRYWPLPQHPDICRVVLVTRAHASGLRAAQMAARQWACGALPTVQLLGLAVVADAPGRRPKPLRELLELVSGGVPRVWELPWVEALRLGDPPGQIPLPAAFSAMAADLHHLVTGGPRPHA
jgi:hypothetical protein